MKLLLYDKFFESFIKLGREAQNQVVKFQKKFREDSTTAALNLEQISTFKDQSLRTARITQKYRAIVKMPTKGDVAYLLWVDNHDEAMDWARNKTFDWNENTQSMQVFEADAVVQQMENQQKELPFMAKFKDEDLLKIGVPKSLLNSVKKIDDMADLEKVEAFLSPDIFEHIFSLLDGVAIEYLIYDVEEGKAKTSAEGESINNQRSFVELTDDSILQAAIEGEFDKWKVFLHPSQRKLVAKSFSGSVKVSGGAGTGKTVVALHRLKHLAAQQPVKPILFTTYTKVLADNLIQLSKELNINQTHIQITNIDALAWQLAIDNKLIGEQAKIIGFKGVKASEEIWDDFLETVVAPFDKQFIIEEYEQVILFHNIQDFKKYLRTPRAGRGKAISRRARQQFWELVEGYRENKKQGFYFDRQELFNLLSDYYQLNTEKPFSHVIADELQDLSNPELRFLRSLVDEGENDLFMVGDPMQTIYSRRINFSQLGINVRGKKSSRLKINYRTTEEIKRYAIQEIMDETYDDFDGKEEAKNGYVSLMHGEVPTQQTFENKNKEVDFLLQQIQSLQETTADFSERNICVAARTRQALKPFKTALHNKKIPYWDISDTHKTGNKNGVVLSTFHSLKGLEYKYIFLVDVGEQTFPYRPFTFADWSEEQQAEHLKTERSLFYVAATRAVMCLWVTGI